MKTIRRFTLTELLVVIAVISILASMLLPVLRTSLETARTAQCLNNLKQIGILWQTYFGDNNNILPPYSNYWGWGGTDDGSGVSGPVITTRILYSYCLGNDKLMRCPNDNENKAIANYEHIYAHYGSSYVINLNLKVYSNETTAANAYARTISIINVPQPTKTMLMGDLTMYAPYQSTWPAYTGFSWHSNRGFFNNVLYVDGHVAMTLIDSRGQPRNTSKYNWCPFAPSFKY